MYLLLRRVFFNFFVAVALFLPGDPWIDCLQEIGGKSGSTRNNFLIDGGDFFFPVFCLVSNFTGDNNPRQTQSRGFPGLGDGLSCGLKHRLVMVESPHLWGHQPQCCKNTLIWLSAACVSPCNHMLC